MRIPAWRRYLRFWRPDVAADVDDELRFHLEERIDDLMALGRTREEARTEALSEFGDVADVGRELREIDGRIEQQRRRAGVLDALRQDVRYAARSIARTPTLAAMVVVTLALGIGVNLAMFSFLEQIFIRPPAGVRASAELRRLWVIHRYIANGQAPFAAPNVTYPQYRAVAAAIGPLARLAPYSLDTDVPLGRGDDAPKGNVGYASADFLPLLGVRPMLGRFFAADEDRPGHGVRVAVLSHAFWRDHFGADTSAIGRTLAVGGERYTIVGVAQPDFTGVDLDATDIWVPLATIPGLWWEKVPWYESHNFYAIECVLRPSPGADTRAIRARAEQVLRRAEIGAREDTAATVQLGSIILARGPGAETPEVKIATRLAGVALMVLLIACANVTNLLLARAMQRRREIAVRMALGISRIRLVILLVLESLLLTGVGAMVALMAAIWGGAVLRALLRPNTHWATTIVDWRVGLVTGAAAVLCGIAIGIAPALQSSRADVTVSLKAGTREGTYQRSRMRSALLVWQAALSLLLLVGAAGFVRSLRNVERLDIGYDAPKLLLASALLDAGTQRERATTDSVKLPELAARVARIPGVEHVALANSTPIRSVSFATLSVPGVDSVTLRSLAASILVVSPEFFATTGLRILRGRVFSDADNRGTAPVVIVNATMARELWPHEDALGRCLIVGKVDRPCSTVVGVAQDARRMKLLEKPSPQYFLPLAQASGPFGPSVIIVRVAPERASMVTAETRRALQESFPGGVPRLQWMSDILAPQYRPWQLGARLFSAFGLLALLIAAIGVYSTLAYTFSQRTHEIGVRIALGARTGDIVRLVLRDGMRVVVAGVAIGIALAFVLGRLVESLLYGVSAHDPLTISLTATMLLGVAALAAVIPARRATRVDPASALRAE